MYIYIYIRTCRSGIDEESAVAMKAAQVVSDVMSIARPARR